MRLMSGKKNELEPFSKFSTLEEFHHHMEMWLNQNISDFTKCELLGLKWLVQFSAKTPGVCNEAMGTILNAISRESYNHGISRTTFKRMLKKATRLGIITIYETEKSNGSQSSNLYVFNRFATATIELPQQLEFDLF